jgi:hypothetical protein
MRLFAMVDIVLNKSVIEIRFLRETALRAIIPRRIRFPPDPLDQPPGRI